MMRQAYQDIPGALPSTRESLHFVVFGNSPSCNHKLLFKHPHVELLILYLVCAAIQKDRGEWGQVRLR